MDLLLQEGEEGEVEVEGKLVDLDLGLVEGEENDLGLTAGIEKIKEGEDPTVEVTGKEIDPTAEMTEGKEKTGQIAGMGGERVETGRIVETPGIKEGTNQAVGIKEIRGVINLTARTEKKREGTDQTVVRKKLNVEVDQIARMRKDTGQTAGKAIVNLKKNPTVEAQLERVRRLNILEIIQKIMKIIKRGIELKVNLAIN